MIGAGALAALLIGGAAVAGWLVGGAAGQEILVISAMLGVILLLLANSYNHVWVGSRKEVQRLHEELARQQGFLRELSPLPSLEDCAAHIVAATAERLRCGRVSLMLPDDNQEYLRIAAARGLPKDVVRDTWVPIGEGVAGQVFRQDRPIHVSDVRTTPTASMLPADSWAYMSAPLLLSGMQWGTTRVGVLNVAEPIGRDDFSMEDEFVFSNLCQAASVALYNQMVIGTVKKGNVEVLETLINALEARDNYTRGHSERVSEIATAIGTRLSFRGESLEQLRTAARLHDVGKIGIPDAILAKRGPLTDEERATIRRHTDIGVKILSQASFLPATMEAVRGHHERLDGRGYYGLTRREIPIAARIIAVADSLDAMTSARPYRDALTLADALEELRRGRGRQFDEACVDAITQAIAAGELADLWPAASVVEAAPSPQASPAV